MKDTGISLFFDSVRPFSVSRDTTPLQGKPVAVCWCRFTRAKTVHSQGDFPVAALTNPGKSEDTLQDAKRMLNLALT